jgi:hypothetical protein
MPLEKFIILRSSLNNSLQILANPVKNFRSKLIKLQQDVISITGGFLSDGGGSEFIHLLSCATNMLGEPAPLTLAPCCRHAGGFINPLAGASIPCSPISKPANSSCCETRMPRVACKRQPLAGRELGCRDSPSLEQASFPYFPGKLSPEANSSP